MNGPAYEKYGERNEEYCEKSYLHSEQKQMVLNNLKDYAIRALVNAVDHLGTVAYKLTDLLDQQSLEISSSELHVTYLHQQLLTCQTYTDREAIRQQQLLAVLPRHHKHYILPNSVSKKVHFSPQIPNDARESYLQPRPRQFTTGTPAANTLSWHLATETKSTLKGSSRALMSIEDSKTSRRTTPTSVHTSNVEENMGAKTSSHLQLSNIGPASSTAMQTLGITQRATIAEQVAQAIQVAMPSSLNAAQAPPGNDTAGGGAVSVANLAVGNKGSQGGVGGAMGNQPQGCTYKSCLLQTKGLHGLMVKYAIQFFKSYGLYWWDVILQTMGPDVMNLLTWKEFKEVYQTHSCVQMRDGNASIVDEDVGVVLTRN
ncbi:hypothetical protein R6Q57_007134 [Mikania cordata]